MPPDGGSEVNFRKCEGDREHGMVSVIALDGFEIPCGRSRKADQAVS